LALGACGVREFATPVLPPAQTAPLPLEGFNDAIHHWRLRHEEGYAVYAPEDVAAIADNILLYQRDHGGWVENRDPTRILSAEEAAQIAAEKSVPGYSFDNRNIYTQIEYLMGAYERTGEARFSDGALAGFELILAAQFPRCGGWPHTIPARNAYHGRLTMADEIMSGNLTLLRNMASGRFPFASLSEAQRARAAAALQRGDQCLLDVQVIQDGRRAGWAGQYDPDTLEPAGGRSFELPALVSQETTEILRYLMSIPEPSEDVAAAIDGAAAWLERSRIDGLRLETFDLPEPVAYEHQTARIDRRLIADPAAPPLWARFYDLADNSVVLANRDGVRAPSYADVHPERRAGYAWYGDWPARLLEAEYPAWRARIGR
jgi:PelA/Pel-15E family pectate lyase